MKKVLCFTMFLVFLCVGTSFALTINPDGGGVNVDENNLQTVMNNITEGRISRVSFIDDPDNGIFNDALSDTVDSYWSMNAGSAASTTMIIEIAGYASKNIFGVYATNDITTKVALFNGLASAGSKTVIDWGEDNNLLISRNGGAFEDSGKIFNDLNFGFYITNGVGETFYSDTSLNSDSFDHMAAFQGNDKDKINLPGGANAFLPWVSTEYVLAWEDLLTGGDSDYQDMVLMVSNVTPVPEPTAMLLFGLGVIGLGLVSRKKLMK